MIPELNSLPQSKKQTPKSTDAATNAVIDVVFMTLGSFTIASDSTYQHRNKREADKSCKGMKRELHL